MTPPIVWTIAGTDPTGGAGIQADVQTMHGLGVCGCSVVTAVLAQNSSTVSAIEYMPHDVVTEQLQRIREDAPPKAIKIGMLGNRANVTALATALKPIRSRIVCDPVLASTSGRALLDKDAIAPFVSELLPQVDILTPNLPEAEILLGTSIRSPIEVEQAANALLDLGPKNILLKGGHAFGPLASDYFVSKRERAWIHSKRLEVQHTHGTGCAFSTALACGLAHGFDILDALVIAKAYVNQGLRLGGGLEAGRGALAHLSWPDTSCDMPWLSSTHETHELTFPTCEENELGFYPVVDSVAWVDRLLKAGVRTLQLRIKNTEGHNMDQEIARAINMARSYQARLYINDHWALAVKYGAYGVHLGQDDLAHADFACLAEAGLRLGISTHSYSEMARAWALRPSYIALGTLFQSPSKTFKHRPLGLPLFEQLRKMAPLPTVAIGGITLENVPDVLSAGADGIAVISAVMAADDVDTAVAQWLRLLPPLNMDTQESTSPLQHVAGLHGGDPLGVE